MASIIFNGYSSDGRDFSTQQFNSVADLTPSGAAGVAVAQAGTIAVNFSGTGNILVTPPSGIPSFRVYDQYGKAGVLGNIVISGNGATYNGAITNTISTNYGSATFTLANPFSGNAYVKV